MLHVLHVPAAELGAWIAEKRAPPHDMVAVAFDVIALEIERAERSA